MDKTQTVNQVGGIKVGDRVRVTGSSASLHDGTLTVLGFNERKGDMAASLSDGQWAYVSELRRA